MIAGRLDAAHRRTDDTISDHVHPHEPHPRGVARRTVLRAGGLGLGVLLLAACAPKPAETTARATTCKSTLPGFDEFASTVNTFLSGNTWMVESTGLPSHNMMVGIVSWQQQFPLSQPFSGSNAFQLPAHPVLADVPVSARTRLYSGAIAVAVNGVPIFNALNNRGADTFLAGELDQWGGHCGKADDYHYHTAPLHLQATVGHAKPIAYALDGFALYGSTEPDGSPMLALDDYNGHLDAAGLYHYHGTTSYPYINGGLKGKVTVAQDAVTPQPATHPFRPPGDPLRGATITAFQTVAAGSYRLTYTLNGVSNVVAYQVTGSSVTFTYTDSTGASRTENYTR